MTCRDVRELADSFLSEQLLTETNHEILSHLDSCPACREDIAARRRLRNAVRDAFARAPELQPQADFENRLRDRLRETAARDRPFGPPSRRWLGLAAGVVLIAGLSAALVLNRSLLLKRSDAPADVLAQDAIGDHRNCALQFRLERKPIPLEQAAERYDRAYRVLLDAPPDDVPMPDGAAHVLERHACVYGGRRFGHVVMRYRGRVVSLLMTDGVSVTSEVGTATPHRIGRRTNGLSVVAVSGSAHAVLLVSDLEPADLTQLSNAVALPLVRRLEAALTGRVSTYATLHAAPASVMPTARLRDAFGPR